MGSDGVVEGPWMTEESRSIGDTSTEDREYEDEAELR